MLQSRVRLYCKIEPGAKVDRIFLKLVQFNNVQMPEISKMFPKFKACVTITVQYYFQFLLI